MYHKHAFQSDYKGRCGGWGRSKFNEAWGRGRFSGFGWRPGSSQPPVNIEETDDAFVISLYAAGLKKETVALTVKEDVLQISYPGTGADNAESGYTYQEYRQGAFERLFRLNGKVLTEAISASYADGILKVTLPKNPETNQPAQTITVG
ncbi:Hsp20/alpha crystallin family protein [Spirosoma sordidisoli]|uniref:Hsp20/alpha crystallin family protein n=1 Tax=Spirosoma sordidisoli TaxID=2502893 RepID=A0A4Q2ULV3_9BACT|nr:Hsp20/alpha crystallin family protein [Spirosoma sordidisoli]RYC70577.1 Hsp20/alpha crystallin family protein [Spirosoma sordidisoli]